MTETHSHTHDHDHEGHRHGALRADDYAGLLHEMNHRLSTLGRQLTAEQWLGPSLCEGWRVCDVFGHMTYGGMTPLPKVLPLIAFKYRGNVNKGSKFESIRLANAVTQTDMMAKFDASCAKPKGIGKLIKDPDVVLDHVVHELDVRRPLGLAATFDDALLVGALDAVASAKSKIFAPSKVAAGLRLRATNVDWAAGPDDAPTVEGAAEDLLLAVSGRRAGLAGLAGTGVDEVARRTLGG